MSADDILRHRLSLLPRKTGLVLQQLYQTALISDGSLGVILDAGEVAGDCNKLLGVAVAYGELRAAGVPVADTLAMARRLGARVNLGWGARRWTAEHDRFARAETLKRLSEENIRYDLSGYDRVIDGKFPGYLIRTSRRLGMEGLRQRHCVASYHERIKAGHCAIATVFVAGERWTVELRLTGNAVRPLVIGQIRTRRNASAGGGVRETISGFFNVPPDTPLPPTLHDGPVERVYLDNTRRVLPLLRACTIKRVEVTFDGCGDSGSISDVCFEGAAFDADAATIEVVAMRRQFTDGRWVAERVVEPKTVREAIMDIVYEYLEETGVDWYNNDGGFGDCIIDVENGTIALDVSTRFTESEMAYCAEREIETGDDVD